MTFQLRERLFTPWGPERSLTLRHHPTARTPRTSIPAPFVETNTPDMAKSRTPSTPSIHLPLSFHSCVCMCRAWRGVESHVCASQLASADGWLLNAARAPLAQHSFSMAKLPIHPNTIDSHTTGIDIYIYTSSLLNYSLSLSISLSLYLYLSLHYTHTHTHIHSLQPYLYLDHSSPSTHGGHDDSASRPITTETNMTRKRTMQGASSVYSNYQNRNKPVSYQLQSNTTHTLFSPSCAAASMHPHPVSSRG